jgi:Zn-dependent M28 family amino/carboxypeptidase
MTFSSPLLRRAVFLLSACAFTPLTIAAPAVPTAAPVVAEAPLRAHLSFLADDLLEGRGTGQRGGDLAVRYLETQAAALGLQPLGGGYRQAVAIVGSKALPDSEVGITAGGKVIPSAFGSDLIYGASNGQENVRFDAPIVFVGYGIHADEERWDDYKDADVKGKLLIMMVNDPQPTAAEPERFAGKSLSWYGRWVYKYEEALRHGAAGVLLIHTTASASYPWSVPATSFAHERFNLAGAGNAFEGWIAEDAARALFTAAGQDLDALRARAESRDFRPVPLDAQIHVALHSAIRQVQQFNIVGVVPGTDPAFKDQAVIYSAHWDHLGIGEAVAGDDKRDRIWNGAVDNASGAAALLAMAQAAVKHPARRAQIFFWPCGEEQGLLGSLAYVRQPLWPLAKTTADLNLDSMNFVGKTRDMGVAGSERSSLYASAGQVAATMGLRLAPAVPDLGGAYFRADHFNFARAGVPAFNVGSAVFSGDGAFDFVTDPQGSSARMKAFTKHYHQVSDEYHADWDLSGMVQQAQFTLNLGYAVANTAAMPRWNKGEAFGNIKR